MIVYLASEIHSGLFDQEGWMIKTYMKWQIDVQDFIKTEYANLMSVRPEAIIVEQNAVSNWEDVTLFKKTFPEVEVIFLMKDRESVELENCHIFSLDENAVCKIKNLLFPEEKKEAENIQRLKIGILPENEEDFHTAAKIAFHLLSWLAGYTKDICLIEVSKDSNLPIWAKHYGWKKMQEGYEYQGIPILYNAVMENRKLSIFLFLNMDEKSQRMHGQCDIPLKIRETDEKEIELSLFDKACLRKEINEPFQDHDGAVYQELFREHLKFLGDTGQAGQTSFLKDKKTERKRKKKAGNFSKWKKRGILAFLLLSFFCLILAAVMRFPANVKEKELESAVQKQAESTKENASERTTAVTQADRKNATTNQKKKATKKEKTSGQIVKKNTTAVTKQHQGVQTRKKTFQQPKKTTASKKKKETAKKKKTARKETTTTAKKKPTTTQTFDIDYKVE